MIIHWKAVDQYSTVVLFVFQFYPLCNFGKFISFGLGTVRRERVKKENEGAIHSSAFCCSSADIFYAGAEKNIMLWVELITVLLLLGKA